MSLKCIASSQRDAFWDEIYQKALQDKDIVVVSADMGAPALDQFRRNIPSQFINAGIAEQNATLVATGLSLMGKKVYTYAIAPFITLRCIEQIRVTNAIMRVPITIVGVGTGFGYEDSGPTHHLIEDVAMMRAMPNIDIYNVTDTVMAKKLATITCGSERTTYLRIERKSFGEIYTENDDFGDGMSTLIEGDDCFVFSTGTLTHTVRDIVQEINAGGKKIGLVDVYKFPIDEKVFIGETRKIKKIFSIEEHFLPGGFGSAISELVVDNNLNVKIKRFGIPHSSGYCYKYGGRDKIHSYYNMTKKEIIDSILKYFSE